jgi:hypothetical protein
MYNDNEGFLSLKPGSELRRTIIKLTPRTTWETTAKSLTEKGFPCRCIFKYHMLIGILFENPSDKLLFLLKLENVLS